MVTVADEPELPVGARSPVDERLDPLERPLTPSAAASPDSIAVLATEGTRAMTRRGVRSSRNTRN